MQGYRHLADYDPTQDFARPQVRQLIGEAEDAISGFEKFEKGPLLDRRALAIYMLLRIRQ